MNDGVYGLTRRYVRDFHEGIVSIIELGSSFELSAYSCFPCNQGLPGLEGNQPLDELLQRQEALENRQLPLNIPELLTAIEGVGAHLKFHLGHFGHLLSVRRSDWFHRRLYDRYRLALGVNRARGRGSRSTTPIAGGGGALT